MSPKSCVARVPKEEHNVDDVVGLNFGLFVF